MHIPDSIGAMDRAIATWREACEAMVPVMRAFTAGPARALANWGRVARPPLVRQQVGRYAKPTTKKIRRLARSLTAVREG